MPVGRDHGLSELRSRFRGCLVGVVVGDALGAPFEGAARVSETEWERDAEGNDLLRFTDDSHMTFGVIESLLARPELDPAHMGQTFLQNFKAEPRRGYGAGPPQVFARVRGGAGWNEAARALFGGTGSWGNGAAMRVAPVGLAYAGQHRRLMDAAARCASITHAHPLGIEGAAVQAAAVAAACLSPVDRPLERNAFLDQISLAVSTGEFEKALTKLRSLPPNTEPGAVASSFGNGIEALEAVPAALACFMANETSFVDTIRCAVLLGGDTDTIASMAGAISGARLGESAIPEGWRRRTEGAGRMTDLADALLAARRR